jgi:MFS family permease
MNSAERLSGTENKSVQADILSHMYSNQVGVNLGKGLADPYVPLLALHLGATTPQLGWLQAFINLFPAVMQVPWGKLSDFFRRRIPFLIAGGVMSFSLYFFMVGAINAWHLIIIVALQLCIGSMMIPTWSALVGDVTTVRNRGSVMSRFFAVATLASVIGMAIGGLLIPAVPEGETMSAVKRFGLPFFMAGFMGIFGSAILYEIMEEKRRMYASPKTLFTFSLRSFIFISDLKENLHFRNLVVLNTFFNFIMSIIWPILILTYVEVLHASAFEIGVISITSVGATLFFQTRVGKLLDLIGPMPQILISRFAFISVPIVYALATEVWHIYVLNIALGFASAMANVAFFAYIMDVAPDEKRGEYFAVYNTIIGVATFFGAIIGGYLALFFQNYYAGELVLGLGAVYAISAVGRAAGALWFLKLKDPVKYPDTLRGVIKRNLRRWHLTRHSGGQG